MPTPVKDQERTDSRSVHQSVPLGNDERDLADDEWSAYPKRAVNYRAGSADKHCADCAFFTTNGGCKKVQGQIAADMLCDLWEKSDGDKPKGAAARVDQGDAPELDTLQPVIDQLGSGASKSDHQLANFFSVKNLKLDDDGQGGRVSWIPIFPEGSFQHPEYGELDFSQPKLDQYLKHFNDRVRKIDIAVDIDHKQEQAAGWLKRIQYQGGQNPGLYGYVEWNNLGAGLLADKRYKYISPQFGEYTDEESGRVYPNTLTCATLTNFPFLKKMPAIALSEMASALTEVSNRAWSTVNKSKLPNSSFLLSKARKLPVFEGRGQIGEDGRYQGRGALNLNGVKAAHAAVHGARSGKAMSIPQSVHDRLHRWLSQYAPEKEGGLSARQRSAAEIRVLKTLTDSEFRRFYLMARQASLPKFIQDGDPKMGKPPVDDNDDDDMKDLADAEDSSMKGKKAKRADDGEPEEEQKADDGYDDEDVYQDGSMDNYEDSSKNKSQPHLRPGKAKASTPTASEKAVRALAETYASENKALKEQMRQLQLAERKREVKDQVRQLAEPVTVGKARLRFARPIVDEFEKLALADRKAGDQAFALLKLAKATEMVDVSERGRGSDIEDELNDPFSINDKVLSDPKSGMAIVGSGLEQRAKRFCAEQKLDWDKLPDRERAFKAVMADKALGSETGVKRD